MDAGSEGEVMRKARWLRSRTEASASEDELGGGEDEERRRPRRAAPRPKRPTGAVGLAHRRLIVRAERRKAAAPKPSTATCSIELPGLCRR